MLPKTSCDVQGIDLQVFPPSCLIAGLMQLPMMTAAERHGELITDLETDRPRLRKPQMMRIGGLPPANQARLGGNKFQVCLVAQALGLGDGELALVDFGRRQGRLLRAPKVAPLQLSSLVFAWSWRSSSVIEPWCRRP